MRFAIVVCLFIILPFWCPAHIPAYYSNIDFSTSGDILKNQLHQLIKNAHSPLDYTNKKHADTWKVLLESDQDLADSKSVVLLYGSNDIDKSKRNDRRRSINLACHTSNCTGKWNREHVFPKSLSSPKMTKEPGIGTDIHNLRAADGQMNNYRSNNKYRESTGHAKLMGQDSFYPGDEWKGDVARIIMYMYVRYKDRCKATYVGYGKSTYAPFKDMPDIFLEWNAQDPPSQFEINRNNIIYRFQGNRNPFIDNPYLATLIWNGPMTNDVWSAQD
jgi:endonuclease I